LTFLCGDALATIEETLHGPLSSPRHVDATGPEQTPLRDTPTPLDGLNPILVTAAYHDATLRQAVTEVALIAVADVAAAVAHQRANGEDWQAPLRQGADQFRAQVRSWVAKAPDCDPTLRNVLNSFVRRRDRSVVNTLATALARSVLDSHTTRRVWQAFDMISPLDPSGSGPSPAAAELISKVTAVAEVSPEALAARTAAQGFTRSAKAALVNPAQRTPTDPPPVHQHHDGLDTPTR
jgi:hypothetical protein